MKKFVKTISVIIALILCFSLVACGNNDGEKKNLYIRYSAFEDGTNFISQYEEGYEYLGFALAESAPTNKTAYTWISKSSLGITNGSQSGSAGGAGSGGSQGGSGSSGGSSGGTGIDASLIIRYSQSADGADFIESYQDGYDYIGFTFDVVAPTDKASYTWVSRESLGFSDQALQPQETILYIRYSQSADGTNFVSTYQDGYDYIGFAKAPITNAPTDKAEYTWISKQSIGITAEDTSTHQLYIRYSVYADGTNFVDEFVDGCSYVGFAIAKNAPTNKTDYKWITNEQVGIETTGTVYVKYSYNSDGTNFTSEYQDGQQYLGVAVGEVEPTLKTDYEWRKFVQDKVQETSIKILTIGNSFSEDATEFLWDIYKNAGYENVTIGNLYIGGCSLDTHWLNTSSSTPQLYKYYKNTTGTMGVTLDTPILTGLRDEAWDIITLQQGSAFSGKESSYSNLANLINWVNANKTNQNAKLYWHMTWSYPVSPVHGNFADYDSNQITMYNAIVQTVKNKIVNNASFAGIIPNGTTVQNLRTSPLGDTINRDNCHLTYDVGRFAAALTYYATLSGNSVDSINCLPYWRSYWGDTASNDATYKSNASLAMPYIKESVKNAIENPFVVTNCKNTLGGLKFVAMESADGTILTGIGKNANDYLKVDLEWTINAFYDCKLSNPFAKQFVADNPTLAPQFNCTRVFTKDDLPVGTVIYLASGYQYRPDGTYAYNSQIPEVVRPAKVLISGATVVDNTWHGSFNFRAFNVNKSDGSNVTSADTDSALKIFVPKASLKF